MGRFGSVPKKYEHIDFKPPKSVADAAKKGLEYREKASPSNRGGLTPAEAGELGIGSGVQRAVNLKNRDNISPDVIKQMKGFLSRSESSSGISPEHREEPWNDKGYVSWLLWGGDPGKSWVERVYEQMEKADAETSEGKEAKALVSKYVSELESSIFWAETGMGTAVETLLSYIKGKVPKKFVPRLEALYPRVKSLHLELVAMSNATREQMRRRSKRRDPEAEATAKLEIIDTGLRNSLENLMQFRKAMEGDSQSSAELERVLRDLRGVLGDFESLKREIEAYQRGYHPLDWLNEVSEEVLKGLKFASETGDGSEHVGVFAPLPEHLASQFPNKEEDKSRPHVTLYYIGPVPEKKMQEVLVETLRDFYAEEPGPITARLSGVDYFRSPSGCVAYSSVVLSRDMGQMKDRIKAKLLEKGLEFKDDYPLAFNPHVTLAYYDDPHAVWDGPVPSGSWTFNEVEIWGLKEVFKFRLGGYLPMGRVGEAKKDVGQGGLDEWFSGHGGDEGEATWGDWVSISPVKRKVEKELSDGTVKEETIQPGDIIGPCGISEDPNWDDLTNNGKDPLKCMPRQKAYDMPKSERAELAREKMRAEKKDRGEGKSTTDTRTFEKESAMVLAGENEPTNPKLWEKSKEEAKSRYDKWPSAYAVGHALKLYKEEGGGWRKKAGWWESESGNLIGDGPADVIHGAVEEVREMYRSHPEIDREPTLEELWGTVEFVTGPEMDRGEISKRASFGKHILHSLPYAYDALEPYISEKTLRFHHDKHHRAYVDGLNKAERDIQFARESGDFESIPALNASLAFNSSGDTLHTMYWESLTPDYEAPSQTLVAIIERDFGSWNAFRAQMEESTVKVRGSGWGVLVRTREGLRILTVMNHENGLMWEGDIILPIDAWEHAYYLDYQNDRKSHFEAVFDHLVNWSVVERRLTGSTSPTTRGGVITNNKTGGGALTAATVTVDRAHVGALRKDVLMIARAADNVDSLEDIEQVTQAIHSWRKQWETLAYTLRQDLEGRLRQADRPYDPTYNANPPNKADAENYLNRALAPMWDFDTELGRNPRTDGLLKDAYGNPWKPPKEAFEETVRFYLDNGYAASREEAVRKAKQYHDLRPLSTRDEAEAASVARWKAEAVKWTRRLREKARKAWETLNGYVDWLESWRGGKHPLEVVHPEEEVVPLAGFRVIFRGFAESTYKNELESVRVGMERYRKAAAARAPLLLKMTPPIFIEWTFEPTSSGSAAAYYTNNQVNITPWVISKDIDRFVKTMAHEVGHHLFRVYLAKDAKDAWAQFIRNDYRDLDLREALAVMDKVGAKSIIDESLMREDPILHIQLSTLMNDPGYSRVADWLLASGIRKYLDAGENPIIRVPTNPITGYAGKNSEEAFCEALGNLVGYGPKAVPDAVLKMLRSVLGDGVRIASSVAAAWLNRTASGVAGFHGWETPPMKRRQTSMSNKTGGGSNSPMEKLWGPTLVKFGADGELIPGGRAEGRSPGDFDKSQIEMGMKVEQEHLESGGYSEEESKALATEIAMDHLAEIPDYYTRLKKMEDEAIKKSGGMESALPVKTACIIAAGEFGGSMTLLKNRDRNYSPEVKVFHSVRNGVEILYMKDETTGWVEGINEYGIGIVNSALMVGHDEAEKKLVRTVGKKSKDGERILRALESKDVEEALESLKTNMGGVKGHTFVSDAKGGYTLEMTSKHNPVVTPIGKEINVRTNHGFEYPDAGYTEGDDLVSSVARRETAKKKLEGVESPRMVAPTIYGHRLKDLSDSNNMVRDTSNMRTVSQMVLDLKSKRMFLYLIPGKVRYLGFEEDLPEGHEPKLRFDLYKYTDIDGDGDFDIIKKQPKKVVIKGDGKKANGGPDLEKVKRVNREREVRASLRAEWGEFKFGK